MPLILHADTNPVTEFFPVEPEPVPDPVRAEPTAEEVDDMARTVLQSAVGMPGTEVPNKFIYEAYRKVDDLPPTAKLFYNALSKYLEQTLKKVPIFKSKTNQFAMQVPQPKSHSRPRCEPCTCSNKLLWHGKRLTAINRQPFFGETLM